MASISFNNVPDSSLKIENGYYDLLITEAKIVKTTGGYNAVQLTWENTSSPKFKVNYDNSCFGLNEDYFNFDDKAIAFGCAKLKAINEATKNIADLDPDILVKILPGQRAHVKVKVNDKGYPEIDGTNIEKYEAPIAQPEPVTADVYANAEDDPFALNN